MVGIVVVSHSEELARGVVALARQMGGEELALEAAGGTEEPGVLGTDAERVRAAIEQASSPDGVLVLMDLGSALMSAEMAVEMLSDPPGQVLLTEAPLVEGCVAAAVAAAGGAALEQVASEARRALAMKASQLGAEQGGPSQEPAPTEIPGQERWEPEARAEIPIRNRIGLHARPAARVVETARRFEAEVRLAKAPDGAPVPATSLTEVVALGARLGDTVIAGATGRQAREAVQALERLASEGFGEGVEPSFAGAAPAAVGPAEPTERPVPPVPPAPGDVLQGVPASSGTATGPALLLHEAAKPPPERSPDTPEEERARLDNALEATHRAIEADRGQIAQRASAAEAAIFDAHLALLEDEALLAPAHQAIEAGATAERAWHDAAAKVAERYRALEEPLLRERAVDVLDVGRRVVEELTGGETPTEAAHGIAIAAELTPADAARLEPGSVAGVATAHGTATAHAAILARALGLPAVVGLGDAVLAIEAGTPVLLDGDAGTLQVQPAEEEVRTAAERRRRAKERHAVALERAHEPAATRDGTRIEVYANLGAPGEAARAVELGAEGVGLLRTEFLFLERPELPGEEEQARTLSRIAEALDGRPLIVRTLDVGADKPLPAVPMAPEANPFLGVRGIRLALARPALLDTQLRAILRVAAEHPVRAMLPMVSTLEEVRQAREALERAREQTGVDAELELGIMVEVPAAALMAAGLAAEVDFFSLGTNDLTQYAMAAERGNERLAPLLTGPQPAVLELVRATAAAAGERGIATGVCGELAGDPPSALLLVGLGVRELSMAPALIPEVKEALRQVSLSAAREAALEALKAPDASAARAVGAALL